MKKGQKSTDPIAGVRLNEKGKEENMFVVTKSGHRLPVDDSSIDYNKEYVSFHETVGLYTKDTILRPIWYLELNTLAWNHGIGDPNRKDSPLEFVAEIEFNHRPTEEEILWYMARYNLSRYDIAFIREGYALDMEDDD